MKSQFQKKEIEFLRNASIKEIWKYCNLPDPSLSEPVGTFYPVGVHHDYWNLYAYGNEIKVVYIKSGIPHRKEKKQAFVSSNIEVSENEKKERFKTSLSRTKSKVFEIASCNEFQHFCTFTLDKNKRDRFNLSAFSKSFAQFIRNLNRDRDIKIKYLNIPEQHSDGAWHMHGLLLGLLPDDLTAFTLKDNIPLKLKKRIKNGEKIYNFPAYSSRFGYFTATEIKDNLAVSKYVTKYITKDLQSQTLDSGAHMYYASQGLKRREVIVKNSFDECPVTGWDFENDYVKIKTLKI